MPQAAAAMCYNRLIERGFGRVARGGPTVPVRRKEALAVGVFLLLYFVLNLLFLTRYPLVHSDESWLGGLTRNMLASGSPAVTEPFFDLKPRTPHAIKILYHLLQMGFVAVFGYHAWALRLLSLIAGCASLALAFRCCRQVAPFWAAFSVMATLAVCAQLIQAAHTARQEALLLLMLLWLTDAALSLKDGAGPAAYGKLGLIAGLSAGLHPNGFLLAMGGGAALLLRMAAQRRFSWKALLAYIGATGAVALVFVGLSFLFDSQFPAHYRRYGETEFDLSVPVTHKLLGFAEYLRKLWQGESGTYTLPDLKAQLALAALLLPWGVTRALRTRDEKTAILAGMPLGAALGTALIGRYNQLSAVLWMLPCLLLLAPLLGSLRKARLLLPPIWAALLLATWQAVAAALPYDYNAYLKQVATFVPPQTKVLANLNTGFYFDNDALLDVRNLAYLKENGLSFAEYVASRGIRAILWPEEMRLIYDRRPAYNALYGNPRAVPEVEAYLAEHCTLLGTFESPGYAMRIAALIGGPWRVSVYRVDSPAGS